MSDKKSTSRRKTPVRLQEHLSLFQIPGFSGIDEESNEPQHPFLERMISIERKLDLLLRIVQEKDISVSKSPIIDNAEFIQLFRISGKTAQNWRDEGLIRYSQVKGKIYYRIEDVENLLNSCRI